MPYNFCRSTFPRKSVIDTEARARGTTATINKMQTRLFYVSWCNTKNAVLQHWKSQLFRFKSWWLSEYQVQCKDFFFTNKFTTIGMAFWQGTHQCVFINKVQKRRLRMFWYATDIGHSTAGQGQKRPIQGQHMQSVAETQTIIVIADLFRKLLHTWK